MLDDTPLRADRYRDIARELRCLAFWQLDLCRAAQLMSLSKGFDRFADRIEPTDEKIAAD